MEPSLIFGVKRCTCPFYSPFAVLAALSFFVETERNDESISTILHSPLGLGKKQWAVVGETSQNVFLLASCILFLERCFRWRDLVPLASLHLTGGLVDVRTLENL